jgi:P27 family predicted phage terminase small subunit
MRGRPRKPLPDLLLDGRYRSDRHGEPCEVWLPDGAPTMPDWLTDEARELWEALVPPLAQRGVATEIDAAELAAMCDWWKRYRQACRALDDISDRQSNTYYRTQILAGAAWKNFSSAASRFGLNPSDRAKLRLGVEPRADDLLTFAHGSNDQGLDSQRSR